MEHIEGIIAEIFSGLGALLGGIGGILYILKGGKKDENPKKD